MPHEEHKATYRHIIAAISAGDDNALEALMAADLVDHHPVPSQRPGLPGFTQWMATARRSFPDLYGTVEHVLAEGTPPDPPRLRGHTRRGSTYGRSRMERGLWTTCPSLRLASCTIVAERGRCPW